MWLDRSNRSKGRQLSRMGNERVIVMWGNVTRSLVVNFQTWRTFLAMVWKLTSGVKPFSRFKQSRAIYSCSCVWNAVIQIKLEATSERCQSGCARWFYLLSLEMKFYNNVSIRAVFSCVTVYYAVQGGSNFESVDEILKCDIHMNSSWKIKWYASFHLEYFGNYGLLVKVMHFYYSFWDLQLMFIHFACYPSSVKTS